MNTGDQPAFPSEKCYNDPVPGMTYRQWIIGQIASGVNATELEKKHMPDHADWTISFADAIIARLDKERGER